MLAQYIDPEEVYYTSIFLIGMGLFVFLSFLLIFFMTRVKEKDIDLSSKIK